MRTRTRTPNVMMQGVSVPAGNIDPALFAELTRRQRFVQKPIAAFAGLGQTDEIELLQAGIIAGIDLILEGSLVVTPGTGTVATTGRWPKDLISLVDLQANGATDLTSCTSGALRARHLAATVGLTDKGVAESVGNATVYSGTGGFASDSWGVGQSQTAIATGTYPVALLFQVPIAMDYRSLTGAVFGQTTATRLNMSLKWEQLASLFTLTGNATVALTLAVQPVVTTFRIPQTAKGIIVPDLSVVHQISQLTTSAIAGGATNEISLAGQGPGKSLVRLMARLWNGNAPVVVTSSSVTSVGWRYGTSNTPEMDPTGDSHRASLEEQWGWDAGAQGWVGFDFATVREVVDESENTEIRLLLGLPAGTTVTKVDVVQELLA